MSDYDTWLSTNPGEPTAHEEEMFLQWCEKNGIDPEHKNAWTRFEDENDQRI